MTLALAWLLCCLLPSPASASDDGNASPQNIRVFGGEVEVIHQSRVPTPANNTDFGRVNVLNRVGIGDFAVTNVGSSTVAVQGASIQGAHAAEFVLTSFEPTSLSPQQSMLFGIRFDPAGVGLRSAVVWITNSDPAVNPFQFAIQGEGEVAPLITVRSDDFPPITNGSPARISLGTDLGAANIRGGSVGRTITIANEGSAVLEITGVSVTGPWAGDFTMSNFSPRQVGVGGFTQYDLVFEPSALGDRWATLWITNDAENPFRFDVRGTGIGFPIIAVLGEAEVIPSGGTTTSTTNGTDFGDVLLDGTFAFRSFTITNRGDDVLQVFAPLVSGTNAADFVVTQFPAASVPAGGSTSIGMIFTPQGKGLRLAELSIANGDSDRNPYTFEISGRGVRVPIPQRLLPPRLVDGRVQLRFGDMDGQAMTIAESSRMELQHSPTMRPGSWIPVPNSAILEGGMILIEDVAAPASPLRFYRVIER